MAAKMICRVCGKEYTGCRNARVAPGVFRWQEVACSPECGDIYLERIIASRTTVANKPAKRTKKEKVKESVPVVDEADIGSAVAE